MCIFLFMIKKMALCCGDVGQEAVWVDGWGFSMLGTLEDGAVYIRFFLFGAGRQMGCIETTSHC